MLLFAPLTPAYAKITADCGTIESTVDSNGNTIKAIKQCDFNSLMELINKVIDFLLFYLATPLAALAFCYAGFIMITAGGSSEKVTKAKTIIKNVVFGYILALAAWLIIKTIMTTLGYNGPMFLDTK
jgi:hypothetical protein